MLNYWHINALIFHPQKLTLFGRKPVSPKQQFKSCHPMVQVKAEHFKIYGVIRDLPTQSPEAIECS